MKMLGQHINNDAWSFSQFQIDTAAAIEKRESFQQWVTTDMRADSGVREPGPFTFCWYERDVLHVQRVGVSELLGDETVAE